MELSFWSPFTCAKAAGLTTTHDNAAAMLKYVFIFLNCEVFLFIRFLLFSNTAQLVGLPMCGAPGWGVFLAVIEPTITRTSLAWNGRKAEPYGHLTAGPGLLLRPAPASCPSGNRCRRGFHWEICSTGSS